MLEQHPAEAPALQVGGDHDPADVPDRCAGVGLEPAADGTDEPARDPHDVVVPVVQRRLDRLQRLVQRRDVEHVVGQRLLHPAGPLQGQDLADVAAHGGHDLPLPRRAHPARVDEVGTALGRAPQ